MKRLFLSLVVCALSGGVAAATNLVLGASGRVTIELVGSDAAFHNTLSIMSPTAAVAFSGCRLEPAVGLTGTQVLSEKSSQRGCRVDLDSDPVTPGIQGFAAGTTFEFRMCAQINADANCEFVWSSNPSLNSDSFDHVHTTAVSPFQYRLNWEDTPSGGDNDFNDLIANVRVAADADGDALWDDWEQMGIDTDGDGTIDLDLPALGANWRHKDIFLEIDSMDCAVAGSDCSFLFMHDHRPKAEAVAAIVNAFAAANVPNPDGVDGINIHIDVSNAVRHQNVLNFRGGCFDGGPGAGDFDTVKSANFNNARRFAFHYALMIHQQQSGNSSSGCGEMPGNDFVVAFGGWNPLDFAGNRDVGTIQQQAGTIMHELGHNLQLDHGGSDGANFKPNYVSVMNYRYQTSGIPPTDPDGSGPMAAKIDYSRQELPTLDETNLSEPAGVGDGGDTVFWPCTVLFIPVTFSGPGNGPLNWNCDFDSNDSGVTAEINKDGSNGTLTGFWDWANILYEFQLTGAFEDGVHESIRPVQEMTYEDYLQDIAPELSVSISASPATVTTGSSVTYTIVLKNTHPAAATGVVLTDALPSSLTFVSCSSTLGGTCGGTGNHRTVSFSTFTGGGTATIQIVATLDCAIANGTTITNTAFVTSTTPDSDPTNNSASASITANNPLPVISNTSVDRPELWPPAHNMVEVTVSYNVTDNCDVAGVVRALSVTSNEPENGTGDGDASPDWQVLDANHVRLRAERAGSGGGRIYTITITATDTAGGASTAAVTVRVPSSRK